MATVIQKARVLALSWVSKGTFTFIPINPPMIVAGRHAMEKMVKRAMMSLSLAELLVFSYSMMRPYFSIAMSMSDLTSSIVLSNS